VFRVPGTVSAQGHSHPCLRICSLFLGALGLNGWHVDCILAARLSNNMALPFGETPGARDPRALAILAKTIYRELRGSGFEARDVIALAGELLAQVTSEVKSAGKNRARGE
jgi:hypothetical protein